MATEERFENIEAGIRDLIIVSRIFLDSQKEITGQMQGVTAQMQVVTGQIQEINVARH